MSHRDDPSKGREESIDAEHRCCRFLRFALFVEPGDGPVWLEATGPAGTGEFLATLVDAKSPASGT